MNQGANRLILEGRFLVNIAGAIIRQDALRPVRGNIDWERMFRFADYHRVANMVYLAMLGKGDNIPERWRDLFFDRYVQGLLYKDSCETAEQEILTLLDVSGIPCTVLESSRIHNLYQIQEMAYRNPLKLWIGKDNYSLVKGYMVDQGYVTTFTYKGFGERMKHSSGFQLEIYYELPFHTKFYKKNMMQILNYAYVREPYKHVRALSVDKQFVWMMAQCVYHYVLDELRIREVLDLYLYYKTWHEQINMEYIKRAWDSFRIDEIASMLLALSYMWFGSVEELAPDQRAEDMSTYDVMENRILSRVPTGRETNQQAIALEKGIRRELDKETRKERYQRQKEQWKEKWDGFARHVTWMFPGYKYMRTMYPVLEYIPILLPAFWLVRLLRFLIGRIA